MTYFVRLSARSKMKRHRTYGCKQAICHNKRLDKCCTTFEEHVIVDVGQADKR